MMVLCISFGCSYSYLFASIFGIKSQLKRCFSLHLAAFGSEIEAKLPLQDKRDCTHFIRVQLLLSPSTNVLGEKLSKSTIYLDDLQKFTQNLA